MTPQKGRPIPKSKLKSVQELSDLIKNKKTILIASIKNIPASQFQEIGKKLRGKAIIKVPKKNLIFRTLDSSENEAIKKLKEQIQENVAILFSDLDCFDLAAELVKNKSPTKAKAGQEAPKDIEIQAGPTDLIPGPVISELGALGIQIQIEKGKITIKEPKVIVKEGGKISPGAADIMNKLDIKPFLVGFVPLSAFDTQTEKLYLDIKIDKEQTIEELKISYGKALPFAVEIGYISEDTIKFLIRKAGSQEKALEKLEPAEKENAEDKEQLTNKTEGKESVDGSDNSDNKSSEITSEPSKEEENTPENKSEENK